MPSNIQIVSYGATNDGELTDGQILFGDSPGASFTISANAIYFATLQHPPVVLQATNNIDFAGPLSL